MLADDLVDALGGVLAGIDDDALGTGTRGDDVAVGPPGSGGEASDEHRRQSLLDGVRGGRRWTRTIVPSAQVGSLPRAVGAMTTMGDHERRQAVTTTDAAPGVASPMTAPSLSARLTGSVPSGPTRPARPRRPWSSSPSATRSWRARSTCSSSASRPAGWRPRRRPPRPRRCASRSSTPTRWATSSSLAARLDALGPVIAVQRSARKEERAQKTAESKAEKEKLVAEAEKLAEGTDWRNGANRLRDLLDDVEGAAAPRPGHRRRAVAALLHRADDVHPAPQGALRRGARAPRRRPRRSRSGWPRRPRRSRRRPSGVRPPASTAT